MSPLVLGLALSLGAPALKDKAPKDPPLVGRWAVSALAINGQDGLKGNEDLEYEFTRDGTWVIYRRGRVMDANKRTYTTDAKADPPAVDLTERAGGADPAIYRVEGDTLTLAIGRQGGRRPTTFEDQQATSMKLTMKRVKAD